MEWLYMVIVLVLGTAFGSFCYLVGQRMPVRQSIVNGRSSCDHCSRTLSLWELIPIMGWLILRGRCSSCQKRISFLYPLMELISGFLFIVPMLLSSFHEMELWLWYPLVLIFMMLTASDLHYRLLPNRIIVPAIVLVAVLRVWIQPLPWWEYVGGFVLGGGMLLFVSYIFARLGRPAMGGGDIKLMAFCGLVLGMKLVFLTIFLSALMGSVIGLGLIWSGRMNRQTFLPFGPFIAAATLFSFVFGEELIAWYWQFWGMSELVQII